MINTFIFKRKWVKRFLWFCILLFLFVNAIAYIHAYKFTHFLKISTPIKSKEQYSALNKFKVVLTGINYPRPVNQQQPTRSFETIKIKSNKELECWLMRADSAKGTIVIFHGYGGEKSSMLDKAEEFLKMGYNTMLVDFMGSGGSEGNHTTIGYEEAQEVKDCFTYLQQNKFENIHLFGTSMGAVAIMKAVSDFELQPASIILECPFGSLYTTVKARFKMMHIPSFPMAGLLTFWGGVQNGFWAFSHNPTQYAKKIMCPTLLLYGEKDPKVSREEIEEIHSHLKGKKKLITYPLAGHENYLLKYKQEWTDDVKTFLGANL